MSAHQLAIFGERHVAFDHARAHLCGGLVGFFRMFGKHQRSPAMRDRKVCLAERAVALAELILERTVFHLADKVKGPGTELRFGRVGRRAQKRDCGER